MSINSLIHTSAHDAKITLEGMLQTDPFYVALTLLKELKGKEGQTSRRKVAAAILRKAAKAMEVES